MEIITLFVVMINKSNTLMIFFDKFITVGFTLKIYLPTTRTEQSSIMIDSVFSNNIIEYRKQDAREAMRVVFFCTRKTYLYAQNEIS